MRLEIPGDTRDRIAEQFTDYQECAALGALVCSLPPEHPLVLTMMTAVEVRQYRRAMAQAGEAIAAKDKQLRRDLRSSRPR